MQTTVALSCSTACESQQHTQGPANHAMYESQKAASFLRSFRQNASWSSSSGNNNDIQNIIIFQLIMYECTFLKFGVQQTLCFNCRSVKLSFSGRLSLTESCGETALPGCDVDIDNTCTHVCLYQ